MEERVVDTQTQVVERAPIDPTAYSLSAAQEAPEESFEESEDVTSWVGGSTDFSFEDDDEPPALISKSESLAVDVLHDED